MKIKLRRLLAAYIDFCILVYGSNYTAKFVNGLFDFEWYINIMIDLTLAFLYLIIFIRKDVIFGYESVGKKIMFLRIYDKNGRIKNKKLLVDRVKHSWCYPVYPLMILYNNKSFGDIKYKTWVDSKNII